MGEQKEKLKTHGVEIIDSSAITLEEYKQIRLAALKSNPQAFAEPLQNSLDRPDEKWQERLAKAREKKTSWMVFAREMSTGKIVGMTGGFREDETKNAGEIWGVFVDETKRGQGIAAALMEGILEEFMVIPTIKTAKLEVNVDQEGAKSLYSRFGFVESGNPYPHSMGDGQNHLVQAMEKPLR
jgi:ribosomal protein S18 acetylase RimI-like enzyme